jgi:hypothetical protein
MCLAVRVARLSAAFEGNPAMGETMPRYVIERNLPPGLTEADIDDDAPW